jgi:hypothetical protein
MAVQHTDEQKLEIAKRVCDLYESQGATIESCCEACGISARTFYYWKSCFAEIAEMYKKASEKSDEIFWEVLKPKVKRALERLVEGERKVETKKELGSGPLGATEKETVTESEILPNSTVAIFAAKGLYPDKFADRSKVEHSGEIKTDFMQLPLEKRLKIIEILESE